MKRSLSLLLAGSLATAPVAAAESPGARTVPSVRRFVTVDGAGPGDEALRRWDRRLRRWLEDRRLASDGEAVALAPALAEPWRAAAREEGRPWERLGHGDVRAQAVRAAWAAFRGGRPGQARAIVEAVGRRGPATPLAVPWEWSDPVAFRPEAETFAKLLAKAPRPRCQWNAPAGGDVWVVGAFLDGTMPLSEGAHATVQVADGEWSGGSLRCMPDGRVVAAPPTASPAFIAASDRWPAVVSAWTAAGVEVFWLGDRVLPLTEGTLEAAVALDLGGGPLAALRFPGAARPMTAAVVLPPGRDASRRESEPDPAEPSGRGTPSWLWIALGGLALAAGGVWVSVRENARQGDGVSVNWE
jgi:hypothetical protein